MADYLQFMTMLASLLRSVILLVFLALTNGYHLTFLFDTTLPTCGSL